jgi:uncharacterized membrane protein (DUF373 family)
MTAFIERVEKLILWALIILLLVAILLGTVGLATVVIQEVIEPPWFSIDPHKIFEMFGLFLIILMGLKLMHLVMLSLPRHGSLLAVIEVALIGLGQKALTLDLKAQPADALLALAALVVAMSAAYLISAYVLAKWTPKTEQAENRH